MRLWITICILLLASPAWGDPLSEGLALFEAGEHVKAHKKLSEHLASHPDSPRALFYLGRTETDGAQAQEFFRMFMAKHPKHELADDALFQIAQYYYARGFYVTARQHLLRLLDTYPKSNLGDRAMYRLGLTLLATGEFKAARTRFARMMERHPESPWAPYAKMGMVDAYFGAERYKEAIRVAESLLTKRKNDPVKSNVLYVLAQCYDKLGKKGSAEAARRRIAWECPKSYEATLNPLPPVKTEKASPQRIAPKTLPYTKTGPYTVQVGAFGNPDNATRLVHKLTTDGYEVRIHEKFAGETILHLVRVGGYPTRKAAKAAADDLHRTTGLACRVVKTR